MAGILEEAAVKLGIAIGIVLIDRGKKPSKANTLVEARREFCIQRRSIKTLLDRRCTSSQATAA